MTNRRQWLREQLEASIKKAIPILSFPSVSLMGITVRDLIADPALQAKGMKLIADRTPAAASVSMMDLSVEAEAFGSTIRFSDDEVPTVIGAIAPEIADAEALKIPAVGAGRTGTYIKAIEIAAKLIQDRPVFAGIIGPFSLAGRLMDVSAAMIKCYEEPEMVHIIMQKATAFLIRYAKAYREAGAAGIVMAEPLTGLLSPALAAAFSAPYVKEIVDAVRDENFLVIYHNCGNHTIEQIDSILGVGADAYHFGNAISMRAMLEKIPADTVVMGNVDPAAQFRNGTVESVREETLRILSECCGDHPNFIISSGCDIPPKTPWANIDAFFAAVDEFYAKG